MNNHTWITLNEPGYPSVISYDLAWVGWARDPFLPRVDESGRGRI